MDSTNSTFVNDTMDSIGDSILASPKDIGEKERAKVLDKVNTDALQGSVENTTKAVRAELEMTSEHVKQDVLGDETEAKSTTDLNDNQFIENLKSSMVQNVDDVVEDVGTEVKHTVVAPVLDTVPYSGDPQPLLDDAKGEVSEEFGQIKSSAIKETEDELSSAQDGLSKAVDDVTSSVNTSQNDENVGNNSELVDTVKKAALTAVSDVQAGATVQDAAKKAVTEVVSKVSPDVSSNLSAGLASFTSGAGSPEPIKSFGSTITTTTTTTQKLEPRVTFSDTLDTTSKVTSPTSKTTPISVLVTDTNKTTTNITQGVAALRRQPSTESRDNPFIPDGELSKETDELLKRATIIRDKFYLDQQERERKGLAGIDSTDRADIEKSPIQESVIAPVSAQPAHSQVKGTQPATAEVKPRMRENGKMEDSVSPEGIKPEVEKGAAAPSADSSKTSPEASGENDKDKKKQKKCCSIM